jgi:hypothetical protein
VLFPPVVRNDPSEEDTADSTLGLKVKSNW